MTPRNRISCLKMGQVDQSSFIINFIQLVLTLKFNGERNLYKPGHRTFLRCDFYYEYDLSYRPDGSRYVEDPSLSHSYYSGYPEEDSWHQLPAPQGSNFHVIDRGLLLMIS